MRKQSTKKRKGGAEYVGADITPSLYNQSKSGLGWAPLQKHYISGGTWKGLKRKTQYHNVPSGKGFLCRDTPGLGGPEGSHGLLGLTVSAPLSWPLPVTVGKEDQAGNARPGPIARLCKTYFIPDGYHTVSITAKICYF